MSYYYFGLTKYGTDNQNLFGVDIWGTTEAWRGLFPSAESIMNSLPWTIIIFLYKKEKLEKIEYLFIPVSILDCLIKQQSFICLINILYCIKLNFEKISKLKQKYWYLFPLYFYFYIS